ncbi:glycosyltransferase family 1 protein, partial [bacterium]
QANGIPVIASKIGGLPESVGDGGILIDDYKNPQKWINTIRELLNSKTLMDKLSEKALKRSKKFDAKYSYEKLKHLIKQKLNLEI